LPDYLWPDCDNTLIAIEYERGGLVRANSSLPGSVQVKAHAAIELTGLDKDPGNPRPDRRPTDSDRRWLRRQQAWQLAEHDKGLLGLNDTVEVRELIVENAVGRGMFSIWWSVFAGDQDMRRRLREAFIGTDASCFDSNEDLQHRTGGQI